MTTPSTELAVPVLTIVGHPNKGKSSIVSTIVQDASVPVSPRSGTTTHCCAYPFRLDGKELCRVVDTPGFQRPRAALDWLHRNSQSTADRPETVRKFLNLNRENSDFIVECQLLTPIIEGSGILYVIDGSVPYGPDYDAEMEILLWTGRPSMALINHIGEGNYVDQWSDPLSQYFRIVRTFNAFTEPFERQIQLFTGFSELHEPWRIPLKNAADSLVTRRLQQLWQSCDRIAKLLEDMLGHSATVELHDAEDTKSIARGREILVAQLKEMERTARLDVERIFHHDNLERKEAGLPAMDEDLFSERTWRLFGLSQDQVLALGATGGATTGALMDIGSAGLTLFLGSVAGAVIGTAGAWLGSRQLIKVRVRGFSLGRHRAVAGPIANIQFPWIILGRALVHLRLVSSRNHSIREQLQVSHSHDGNLATKLEPGNKANLQFFFRKLSKGHILSSKEREELGELIMAAIESTQSTKTQERSFSNQSPS